MIYRWPDRPTAPAPPVDLARLLAEVKRYIGRYVVLSDHQATVCTVWVAHCHAFAVADATPYLNVTSAVKQCGKTRLLEVLEPIVPSPWFTGRVSAAVLTRKVDGETPTLLLDESDAAFAHHGEYAEALRAILNSGYRRSGVSSLCVATGHGIGYRDFSTFCPKAIAGIGALPDTVVDRSIRIALRRRAEDECVDRFRQRAAIEVASPLRSQLDRWREVALEALRESEPEIPRELSDRAADVWEPLMAIADLAGGPWPEYVRHAATALSATSVDDDTLSIRLLHDVREVFRRRDDRVGCTGPSARGPRGSSVGRRDAWTPDHPGPRGPVAEAVRHSSNEAALWRDHGERLYQADVRRPVVPLSGQERGTVEHRQERWGRTGRVTSGTRPGTFRVQIAGCRRYARGVFRCSSCRGNRDRRALAAKGDPQRLPVLGHPRREGDEAVSECHGCRWRLLCRHAIPYLASSSGRGMDR